MRNKGFTLIELLVAMAIIAILASIALPSYQSYIKKSRRLDAKDALMTLQFAQEKYRGNNSTYSTLPYDLGLATVSTAASYTSKQGYYTITIQSADGTSYAATATATGAQLSDTGCQTLKVTQTGFVVDSTASCWGLR